MIKVRTRGEQVRRFIIGHVEGHPADIAKVTAERFAISRQAANKHLKNLVDEKALLTEGATRSRTYKLRPLVERDRTYPVNAALEEDVVWRNDVAPSLRPLPENVFDIWHYGFTEMFNNVLDHSRAAVVDVQLRKTAATTEMAIYDDGVGIFHKIQTELGLLDERHAILELAKGKLTTDPEQHTGEGIFFTSRVFDDFEILSGGVFFSHKYGIDEDSILEPQRFATGTAVWMRLDNHAPRTLKKVFDQFTSGDDIGFTKTVVPVRLAQYGDDKLVSRSQAKRLLARIERFRTVILDFGGVESIGQAFADEIFRVFQRQHPKVELIEAHAGPEVAAMIARARATR